MPLACSITGWLVRAACRLSMSFWASARSVCRRPGSGSKRAVGPPGCGGRKPLNGADGDDRCRNVSAGRRSGWMVARPLVGPAPRTSASADAPVLRAQAGVVALQAQHGGDAGEVQPVAQQLADTT